MKSLNVALWSESNPSDEVLKLCTIPRASCIRVASLLLVPMNSLDHRSCLRGLDCCWQDSFSTDSNAVWASAYVQRRVDLRKQNYCFIERQKGFQRGKLESKLSFPDLKSG